MSQEHKSNTDQQQFWQMAIDAWQSSGLSVRQFCKQEGLSEPSFFSWRKRLRQHTALTLPSQADGSVEPFIQVSLPDASAGGVEFVLSSGHTLRIPVGVDRQTLRAVFSVLGEAGLC